VNLNQVTLPVNDMEMSTKFYRDLGFTQIVDTLTWFNGFDYPS